MSSFSLTPQGAGNELIVYRQEFLIPANWRARDDTFYVSGAPGVDSQRVAVVLTPEEICICGQQGVLWALHLANVTDVRQVDLQGISFQVPTATGWRSMIPASAAGLEVSFHQTVMGVKGRLVWFAETPNKAHMWENRIRATIDRYWQSKFGDQLDTRD